MQTTSNETKTIENHRFYVICENKFNSFYKYKGNSPVSLSIEIESPNFYPSPYTCVWGYKDPLHCYLRIQRLDSDGQSYYIIVVESSKYEPCGDDDVEMMKLFRVNFIKELDLNQLKKISTGEYVVKRERITYLKGEKHGPVYKNDKIVCFYEHGKIVNP
jgi:hypothetical protein